MANPEHLAILKRGVKVFPMSGLLRGSISRVRDYLIAYAPDEWPCGRGVLDGRASLRVLAAILRSREE